MNKVCAEVKVCEVFSLEINYAFLFRDNEILMLIFCFSLLIGNFSSENSRQVPKGNDAGTFSPEKFLIQSKIEKRNTITVSLTLDQ